MIFKRIILWLVFLIASFLHASALTPTEPETRIWEISSIGYDAAIAEVTDLGNRTETSTSNYDTAPIHRAITEAIPTETNRTLFGQNTEFKAADGAGTLDTYGDALRESLGPGRLSHPEEWESTLASAKDMGVTVVPREGTMAYSPATGTPGQLILDPEASIGALRHEFQHVVDDAALGYPGMRVIANPEQFWGLEFRGYMQEINTARSIRDFDAGNAILQEMRQRRLEILGR